MNSERLGNVERIYEEQIASLVDLLKARRKELGLAQWQLGKLANVCPKTISKMERHAWLPSIRTMLLLAEAMDMKLSFDFQVKVS